MANGRSDEENSGHFCGLVVNCQQGRAGKAAFRLVGLVRQVEQIEAAEATLPLNPVHSTGGCWTVSSLPSWAFAQSSPEGQVSPGVQVVESSAWITNGLLSRV
eukprot:CAMPEP_0181183888 /NCGR_PEP_ID=MMETSP1096-20121128/8671_1 /TAXON_ID=156174 ORGANISM="Chrysochromulina ericina, Strain CCMP281" /NCGR_SAMPLE_ID=MMETSP1096 /ASSEMBLY_ACC=CAM_ASM_000453 /LENGTH=102 /DNA_ID=CAMNT_0023272609 /DNA_START=402 /DNA_END=711 /DNA_ORIENTATION=-